MPTTTILTKGIGSRGWRMAALAMLSATLFGCDAGSSVDTAPTSEGIRLDQSTLRMDEGSSARLRVLAQGAAGAGREFGSGQLVWSVRDPEIATVADGVVTGLRPGATRVSVTLGGKQSASADVYVLPVPGTIEVLAGKNQVGTVGMPLSQPIRVQARNRQGEPIAGAVIEFSVSGNGSVTPAQVTTGADGIAQASWTLGTLAGDQGFDARIAGRDVAALVLVQALPGEVVEVDVSPVEARTNPGGHVRFTAVARDQYGNPVEDAQVAWQVVDGAVASIRGDGVATAEGEGDTEVQATVTGARSAAISMSASPPDHAKGRGKLKSDKEEPVPGQVLDLSVAGTTSSNVALAFTEISDGTGYPASYEVRYAVSPIRDSFATATPVGQGSCSAPIIGTAVGNRRTCTVEGLSAGTTYDFQIIAFRETSTAVYYGAESNVATGTTSNAATPTTLEAVSGGAQIAAAGTQLPEALTVRVRDAAGAPMSGVVVSWTPEPGSGMVSSQQTVTSSVGTTQVQWTLGSTAGSQTVRATTGSLPAVTFLASAEAGAVATVTVSPATVSIERGESVVLAAHAKDFGGNMISGLSYTWTSDAPGIATVSSSGQVTGIAAGVASIRAGTGGKDGVATVTVTEPAVGGTSDGLPEVVQTLTVDSAGGNFVRLRWTEVNDGAGEPANYQVRYHVAPIGWNWGNATVVTQGTCAGKVEGTAIGQVLTCTVGGLQSGATYDFQLISYRGTIGVDGVYAPSLSNTARATTLASGTGSVSISPEGGTLTAIAETLQLAATAKDATGTSVAYPGINWTSSNDAVATVDGNGKVTAKGAGTALITAIAACCGSNIVQITVAPKVSTVSVSPTSGTTTVSSSITLAATPRDANGYPVSGANVEWSSSDTNIATVDSQGQVTGRGAGQVQISASADGRTSAASIAVQENVSTSPGATSFPNQPTGFNALANNDFSLASGAPWGLAIRNCCYLDLSDVSAPRSASGAGRAEFRKGYTGAGVEPFTLRTGTFSGSPKELYIAFWIRLSSNWYGHQSGVNKIFHIWTNRSNVVVVSATGAGTGSLRLEARTQPSPSYARNLTPNLSSGTVQRGQWAFVEWILKASSAPGIPDGESHIWLNGTKVSAYTDVILAAYDSDRTWGFLEWAPTWGGTGTIAVPDTQYMDIDHIFISGR